MPGSTGAGAGSPGPLSFIAPLAGLLGGIFHHKGQQKQQQAQYDVNKPFVQHGLDLTGARSSLARSIARAYGIQGSFGVDPTTGGSLMDKLAQPLAAPAYTGGAGSTWNMFGDAAAGLSSSFSPQSFEDFMKQLQAGQVSPMDGK